ncbi:MAG TPA: hypothetical protein VFU12_14245 [Glycomyces sp.]|nr:hypothetical protein [Glycomyces sp.]
MNMQHSVRSVPLAPQAPGGRGAPRQDRSAPPRRSMRRTAAEARGDAPRGRRTADSPGGFFSIESPPPLDAPPGIAEITGWELAAAMWREHLPEQLLGVDCASCGQAWPCDAWDIADDLLGQCCESARLDAAGAADEG